MRCGSVRTRLSSTIRPASGQPRPLSESRVSLSPPAQQEGQAPRRRGDADDVGSAYAAPCTLAIPPTPSGPYGHGRASLLHRGHGPRAPRRREPVRGGPRAAAGDPGTARVAPGDRPPDCRAGSGLPAPTADRSRAGVARGHLVDGGHARPAGRVRGGPRRGRDGREYQIRRREWETAHDRGRCC